MVRSFRYRTRAVSGTRGAQLPSGNQPWTAFRPSLLLTLPLVEALRGPVFEPRAEREPARSQHFLDFVQRLAAEVRRLQQLGLGALDQVADVVDVLGLQAVGRAHRELELVDRAQQDRVELRAALGRLVEGGD